MNEDSERKMIGLS